MEKLIIKGPFLMTCFLLVFLVASVLLLTSFIYDGKQALHKRKIYNDNFFFLLLFYLFLDDDLGCILAELYTGYPIFPGENEIEQLACIMEVLDVPPENVVGHASRKRLFFGQ